MNKSLSFEQKTALCIAFELIFHLDSARGYYQPVFDNSIRRNQWRLHMSRANTLRELALELFNSVEMNKNSSIEDILTELNTIAFRVPQEKFLSPEADRMFADFL